MTKVDVGGLNTALCVCFVFLMSLNVRPIGLQIRCVSRLLLSLFFQQQRELYFIIFYLVNMVVAGLLVMSGITLGVDGKRFK